MGNPARGGRKVSAVNASDGFEEKIINNVETHGCHINFVFDPKGNDPSFAYSVGFEATVGQPEVIVFGLSYEITTPMINIVLRLCQDGLALEDWTQIDGLLDGHRCFARDVISEFIVPDYFNSAIWYHRRRTGEPLRRACQIVWPGAVNGLFPWDEGCDAGVSYLQPALWTRRLNA